MSKRDGDLLIQDILQACNKIIEYTTGLDFESFVSNSMVIDAVFRNFEIIGKASKFVSAELKISHPLVEWKLMTDFRNILIHEYFGIDQEKV